MNRLRNTVLSGITLIFLLNGCGSGKAYQETGPAPENTPVQGDALIITGSGTGDTEITYTEVSDNSIYIDCSGGCGDIYIGVEVDIEEEEDEEDE